MKKQMAIYCSKYGNLFPFEVKDFENDPEYTRVSKILEIDFTMIPEDELIVAQIATIDNMVAKITTDSLRKLEELKMKRAELMALTHEAAS